MNVHKESKKGFTLIEMVMVLVIIGLLVAIVMPQFSAQMDDAKEAQTRANLSSLRSGIAIYSKKMGVYPSTLQDMTATVPPILQTIPKDGWGGSFVYAPLSGTVQAPTNGMW